MADRQKEISDLQAFIGNIDTEITMILQHLQWDQKHLLEVMPKIGCRYEKCHRVPKSAIITHEHQCLLTNNGYSEEDVFLPDPLDDKANTLVKLNKIDIENIVEKAASTDLSFKRGESSTHHSENPALEPLTLGRLQVQYTPDERRVIHDAVVSAAPFCHDLSDLALPSGADEASTSGAQKSRAEILAELRDMKRRRTKYRVAPKTKNYSDVLRDVIKTQMEVYSEVKEEENKKHDLGFQKRYSTGKADHLYHSSNYSKNGSHGNLKQYDDNINFHERPKSISGSRDRSNDDHGRFKRRRNDDYKKKTDKDEQHHEDGSRSSHKRRRTHPSEQYSHRERNFDDKKYNDHIVKKETSPHIRPNSRNSGREQCDQSKRKHKKERSDQRKHDYRAVDNPHSKRDKYNERSRDDRKYIRDRYKTESADERTRVRKYEDY